MSPIAAGLPCLTSGVQYITAPYLALVREDAPQREHDLREVYNGLHYIVKCGCPRRYLLTNLPPWWVVYQQAQRWLAVGVFESMAADLRVLLCLAARRSHTEPTAALLDSRTLPSTPESGHPRGLGWGQAAQGQPTALGGGYLWAICWPCTSRPPTSRTVQTSVS